MIVSIISILVILVLVGIVLAVAYPQAVAMKRAKVEAARELVRGAILEVVANRQEIDNPKEPGKLKLSLSAVSKLFDDATFQAVAPKQAILTIVKYKEIVGEIMQTGKVAKKRSGELFVKSKKLEEIGGIDDFEDITFLLENELRKYLEKIEKERVPIEKVR